MRGLRGQRGKEGERLEPGDLGAATLAARTIGGKAVGEEIGVKQAPLCGFGQFNVLLKAGGPIGARFWMSPGGDMLPATGQKGTKFDLSGHVGLLWF